MTWTCPGFAEGEGESVHGSPAVPTDHPRRCRRIFPCVVFHQRRSSENFKNCLDIYLHLPLSAQQTCCPFGCCRVGVGFCVRRTTVDLECRDVLFEDRPGGLVSTVGEEDVVRTALHSEKVLGVGDASWPSSFMVGSDRLLRLSTGNVVMCRQVMLLPTWISNRNLCTADS